MKLITDFYKNNRFNLFIYISGFIILGLAVNMMKASSLGSGAWDTVIINLRDFLNINLQISWVTMGLISFLISCILMIIVMSYRKKTKYLLMLIPVLFVAIFIDTWNIVVFHDHQANELIFQLLLYIGGALLLPFGLSLVVKSSFPAFVFDELMIMMVEVFKAKRITFVRLGIEFTGIFIGAVFGYLTYYHINGTLGVVNVGSFILAFSLAPIMTVYFKILKIEKSK